PPAGRPDPRRTARRPPARPPGCPRPAGPGRRAYAAAAARLTDREAEVLRLMATGRSNPEIAAHLVVGVETVKTHVGNVLTKLGVRDRTQAVIAAYESGFVTPAG
ncbi:response regulator transcription factor, partial [Micromonospora sp. S4605]|uniref:response regulator transcription factor n=1 Tax=Micromonospora sp. S4605 TaxID=1420897 RepID=UPI00406BE39C